MAITFEQALNENEFHYDAACSKTVGPRGGVRIKVERWRRNGATKTWKTRPGEFRLPIKHGMRNYSEITHNSMHLFHVESECPNG